MAEVPVVRGQEEEERIQRRAAGPRAIAMKMFTTKDYNPEIKEHEDIVATILENPYDSFITLRDRLRKYGATASFPEFKGVVAKLIQAIYQDPVNQAIINADQSLLALREMLTHSLMAVQLEGRYVWPYKATILIIEEMLKFLDVITRKKKPGNPYYHNLRYRLYLTYLLDEACPEHVVFPTSYFIGSTFLIKARCVSIQWLGVVTDYSHADQYDNSPIDFWAHDIQHARRLIQEDQRYYDVVLKHIYYYTKRSTFDYIPKDLFYKEMCDYTKSILQIIKPVKGDTEKERAYKNLKKLIIFEVIHEKGWPTTKFSFCRNVPLGFDVFPIETIIEGGVTGMRATDDKFQDPTTLSNVYQKLRKGFYDKVTAPDAKIVNPAYRTAKHIAQAALEFLRQIDCKKQYTFEKMLALVQEPSGAEEFTERPGEINFPNDRDDTVGARFPTDLMPYWQAEEEAPVIKNLPLGENGRPVSLLTILGENHINPLVANAAAAAANAPVAAAAVANAAVANAVVANAAAANASNAASQAKQAEGGFKKRTRKVKKNKRTKKSRTAA